MASWFPFFKKSAIVSVSDDPVADPVAQPELQAVADPVSQHVSNPMIDHVSDHVSDHIALNNIVQIFLLLRIQMCQMYGKKTNTLRQNQA